MKISALTPALAPTAEAMIPVYAGGSTKRITLAQVLSLAHVQGVLPLGAVEAAFDERGTMAPGTTRDPGQVVWVELASAFYWRVDAPTGPVYYTDFPTRSLYLTNGQPRTDCLYVSPQGRAWAFADGGMVAIADAAERADREAALAELEDGLNADISAVRRAVAIADAAERADREAALAELEDGLNADISAVRRAVALLTPVEVTEEELADLKEQGRIVPGQVYWIPEEEDEP